MTVLQNLSFGLKARKEAKTTIRSKIDTTADKLGLKELSKDDLVSYPVVNVLH